MTPLTVARVQKENLCRPHSATSIEVTSLEANRLSGPSLSIILNLMSLDTSMSTYLTTTTTTLFNALIVDKLAAPTKPLLTVAMGLGLTITKTLCDNIARDPQLIVFKTSAESINAAKVPPRVLPLSATFAKAIITKPMQGVTARDTDAEVQE